MKKEVEERKGMSSTERGLSAISEAVKKIERKKRIEDAEAKRFNEAATVLFSNRDVYEKKFKDAVESGDECCRVIYHDLLALIDNFEKVKEGLSFSDIEAMLPDSQGNVNVNDVKEILAGITKFSRVK